MIFITFSAIPEIQTMGASTKKQRKRKTCPLMAFFFFFWHETTSSNQKTNNNELQYNRMSAEQKIKELGLVLPNLLPPAGGIQVIYCINFQFFFKTITK